MIGQESREVERKTIAILKVLNDCPEPLGGRVIARRLSDLGIDLGERAVRYHLKLMDQQGLTRPIGRRDGRAITKSGVEELDSALVSDRVGLVMTKMEMLAYRSSFDTSKREGNVPVNVSLFPGESFRQALATMKEVYQAGLCVSHLIAVAQEGERLGDTVVPKGKVGVAAISNILVVGTLLKAGIPVDSRFGGILQMRDHQPMRFANLIEYSGSSLDPSEVFIASKMTSVGQAAREGNGNILAGFYELPAVARPEVEALMKRLEMEDVHGLLKLGKTGEPVCEMPVAPGRAGMILLDGLNPAGAAVEAGLEVVNRGLSGVIEFGRLKSFRDL
jgi:repressor of nif and glnA expression